MFRQNWPHDVEECAEQRRAAALEIPRCDARQTTHQQTKLKPRCARGPLQDVGMTTQIHAAHRAGFVEMRERAFQTFATVAQQALASCATHAPMVAVDRVARRPLTAPVPSPAIGLRELGEDGDRGEAHQHLIAVIPLVTDQFADGVGRRLRGLDLRGGGDDRLRVLRRHSTPTLNATWPSDKDIHAF